MRTQFRDTQLNFGSGSNINADDIPETSVRKWLSTDFQEIAGEKIFDSPVQVSGSIFSSRDILAHGNIYVNYAHTGPEIASYLYFYESGSPTGAYLRWDEAGTRFVISHGLFLTTGQSLRTEQGNIIAADQGNVQVGGEIYLNFQGATADSYIYFYDGGTAIGQYLRWDDDPGQFEFSAALSMSGSSVVDVADPTNDQDAATKSYVDTVSGSIGSDLHSYNYATKSYVDTVSGSIGSDLHSYNYATKSYVDTVSGSIGSDLHSYNYATKSYVDTVSGSIGSDLHSYNYATKSYVDTVSGSIGSDLHSYNYVTQSYVDSITLDDVCDNGNTTDQNIIAQHFRASGSIYVNYYGPDRNSYIYFYQDGSPEGAHFKFVESVTPRFYLTDTLQINGDVDSLGTVYADGDAKIDGDIYLNYGGPDAESSIYFYNASSPTNKRIYWDEANGFFRFNNHLWTDGNVMAYNSELRAGTDIRISYNRGEGDSYLYFFDGASSTGQHLMWDDDPGQFEFSTQLSMGSNKIVGVTDPTNDQDAATKKYVDDNVGGGGSLSYVSGSAADGTTTVNNTETDTGISVDLTDGVWMITYMGYVYCENAGSANNNIQFWVEDESGNEIDHSGQVLGQWMYNSVTVHAPLHNQFIVSHSGSSETYTLKAIKNASIDTVWIRGEAADHHAAPRTNMIAIRIADRT